MVETVDFLPERYLEQSEGRKNQLFRVLVLCMLGTAILTAAAWQWNLRRQVAADLDAITAQFDAAQATRAQLDTLHQQLRRKRDEAALYACLRHPWPTTRVLAELAGPLPDSIRLTEIRYAHDGLGADQPAPTHPAATGDAASAAGTSASATPEDLAQVRAEVRRLPRVILLTGQTTDPAAVHRYLAALGKGRLFAQVELHGLEGRPSNASSSSVEFRTRLVLRSSLEAVARPSAPRDSRTASREARR